MAVVGFGHNGLPCFVVVRFPCGAPGQNGLAPGNGTLDSMLPWQGQAGVLPTSSQCQVLLRWRMIALVGLYFLPIPHM